jgi:D-3-phosphoglycerate dehydrogenase
MPAKKNFTVLYLGPQRAGTHTPTTEQQSRAVLAAGGKFVPYEGKSDGELIEALKGADVAISQGHRFNAELYQHMGNNGRCKGVVSFGHGFDGVDVNAATEAGVVLANTASFGTEEVSNHTMMMLLVCSRKFVLHNKLVKSGTWTREHLPPMGHIAGQTLGIIGLGNIGRAVARKARAFGLSVIGYDPYKSSWDMKEFGVEVVGSLDELAKRSDYVSPHVFLTPETRHMVGKKFFSLMKPTAYLINCSRGPVVDEAELIKALQEKRIAGAGLDVFEKEPVDPANPLLKMDNVAVTSHYASYSEVAWERGNTQLGEEAVRIALGQWPMSLINPDVRAKVPPRQAAKEWAVIKAELGS